MLKKDVVRSDRCSVRNNECIALVNVIDWDIVNFEFDFAVCHQYALHPGYIAISFQLNHELEGREVTGRSDSSDYAGRHFNWQGDIVASQGWVDANLRPWKAIKFIVDDPAVWPSPEMLGPRDGPI